MPLDVGALGSKMLGAAMPILKQHTEDAASFASVEFKKISQTMVSIEEMLEAKQINQQQAQLLLDMQKGSSRSVLLTVKGLELLAAEEAVNAALAIVKGVVNTAVKFPLIP